MARIVSYKEDAYSQIQFDSGERILLSVAKTGIVIYRVVFFGIVPISKLAEWQPRELPQFMQIFGIAPSDQTPFNYTVTQLASFASVSSLCTFLNEKKNTSSILPLEIARKETYSLEDFDTWSLLNTSKNPNANIEDQLTEFIESNNLLETKDDLEPTLVSLSRTKLLILENNSLFRNTTDTHLLSYVNKLRQIVDYYDKSSPELKKSMKDRLG